jgi:hypothetical protein
MLSEQSHIRSIVLDEGQVDWIMERETPEERLAAWDTLVAVAFPEDSTQPYEPPKMKRGTKLSPVERTKRDAYNIFKRIGLHGVPYGESDSTASAGESTVTEVQKPTPMIETTVTTYDLSCPTKMPQNLTQADKEQIAEWNRRFPDSKSLYDYLDKSYLYQNRNLVCSEEFCTYALRQLQLHNWINYKTGKPHKSIDRTIHYIALDYKKRCGEIRRADEEERQKDMAAEFDAKVAKYDSMESTDIATAERKRRMEAEERWMRKMMEEPKN